ncbi:MAG: hypothetical protein HKUEN01_33840 [Candidatus Kuenenia stuttgartiensis]|nr:MAG: hypothetical protein HKUEN01_33840 [Candidatus Kuenenia stuttgartiensis]
MYKPPDTAGSRSTRKSDENAIAKARAITKIFTNLIEKKFTKRIIANIARNVINKDATL